MRQRGGENQLVGGGVAAGADTIIEVYSPTKQGAGIGYNTMRELNALLVIASTALAAPVVLGQP